MANKLSRKTIEELEDIDEDIDETVHEVMDFLDRLRESTAVNMANAANELRYAYGLKRPAARELAEHWRNTFQERHS